jgi:DNA invertase Pin-like site-specific DNA recombinase
MTIGYRKKYISPETWEAVRAFYVDEGNSVQKTARQFSVSEDRVKEFLIGLNAYRGVEKRTMYILKANENRLKNPGKYAKIK